VQQCFCSHKHKTFKENQKIINIIMGNKTAKFKKMFEEIDTGGDGCVSFHELGEFLATDRATAILGPIFLQKSTGLLLGA
jgi:Ca2+-binding EF-hand superfamily protein